MERCRAADRPASADSQVFESNTRAARNTFDPLVGDSLPTRRLETDTWRGDTSRPADAKFRFATFAQATIASCLIAEKAEIAVKRKGETRNPRLRTFSAALAFSSSFPVPTVIPGPRRLRIAGPSGQGLPRGIAPRFDAASMLCLIVALGSLTASRGTPQ